MNRTHQQIQGIVSGLDPFHAGQNWHSKKEKKKKKRNFVFEECERFSRSLRRQTVNDGSTQKFTNYYLIHKCCHNKS
jgi:hypothetical protein